MGDIDVDFFLGTLKNLVTDSKISYIKEKKHQLESLAEDIKYLREFLKLTEKKRKEHPEVMDLVVRIRDVVSETENIVELFVVRVYKAGNSNQHDLSLDLGSVKKKIKTLRVEVERILDKDVYDINGVAVIERKQYSSTESEGGPSSRDKNKVGEEREVVGFKDEVMALMGKLHDSGGGGMLEIISIIGAAGGGKTTLAREVYDHPLTLQKFEIRVWVNVSQDYNKNMKRDWLISILKSVPRDHEDNMEIDEVHEDKLGEKAYKCLKGKKFLIVMDDIWELEAWNDIQRSFPKEYNESKVMLTSRQPIQPDSVDCIHHFINRLHDSCSWELLRKKVFKKGQCPPELVDIGMQIAKKCKGLPLAIVAIAGILATEDKTINAWDEVAIYLSSIIAKNQEGTMEILELSYNHLPLHLKACFLYIGAHQEDYAIPVRKLIWSWIAEGFIHQTDGGESLEAIAKDHLINLIERNLIMVAQRDLAGTVEACHIHDLLRELCVTKGKEDNFFVQNYKDDSFSPGTNKHRRLFIGNQLLYQFCSIPCAENLRSFFSPITHFMNDRWELPFFVENFKLLRVLHLMNFDTDIGELRKGDLVHLRYLALKLEFWNAETVISQIFCNLSNLEILELNFARDILVPPDVLKMVRLRNLYINEGKYMFHHNYENEGKENMLESLQTLHGTCGCKYCLHFLKRAPNLRELRIQEKTTSANDLLLYDQNFVKCLETLDFCGDRELTIEQYKMTPTNDLILYDLEFLKCLEILHFCGDSEYWSCTRTVELKLPPTITQLRLSCVRLEWEQLSILLQTLPILEVLELHRNPVMRRFWNASELDEGFSQLRCLKLSDLDIRKWSASEDHFPRLEVLMIEHCHYLEGIPIEFANLHDLRKIEVVNSTQSAEQSARKIQEEQKNIQGEDACLNLVAEFNVGN